MTVESVAAPAGTTIAEQALAGAAGNPTDGGAQPAAATEASTATNPFSAEDAEMEARRLEMERLEAQPAEGNSGTAAPAGTAAAAPAAGNVIDTPAGKAATAAAKSSAEGAVIALRKKLSETTAQLLIKEGENKALKEIAARNGAAVSGEAAPAGTEAAAPLTIDEQLDAIAAKKEDLALQVDNGQLSLVDYTKQVNALDKEARELERDAIAEEFAQRSQPNVSNDLALQERTDALVVQYPVLNTLTKEELDIAMSAAIRAAAKAGNPIPLDGSAASTYRLRQAMAEQAERLFDEEAYLARKAGVKPSAGEAGGNSQPGAGAGAGGARPTAQQRESKLVLASELPANIGGTGAGAPAGEMTEEQFELQYNAMNEDQRLAFANANPALIRKLTGGISAL